MKESSSGRWCSQPGFATKNSAAAPLMEKPKWSAPITHSPTTRSPGRNPVTFGPTATTSPDHSCPGMRGYSNGMM